MTRTHYRTGGGLLSAGPALCLAVAGPGLGAHRASPRLPGILPRAAAPSVPGRRAGRHRCRPRPGRARRGDARRRIQTGPVWSGTIPAPSTAPFGRMISLRRSAPSRPASSSPPTGSRPEEAEAKFLANVAGREKQKAVGFTLVDDERTGVRIGFRPSSLPRQAAKTDGGNSLVPRTAASIVSICAARICRPLREAEAGGLAIKVGYAVPGADWSS